MGVALNAKKLLARGLEDGRADVFYPRRAVRAGSEASFKGRLSNSTLKLKTSPGEIEWGV